MERVAVVGSGGAGKTTFATRLGARLGLPVVHLDAHYWRPGWVRTPAEEWRRWQEAQFAAPRWIADGNYGSTLDVRLARADTVIVVAPPAWRCVLGVLRRWVAARGRPEQAPGCPERLTTEFLRWVWRYRRDSRPILDAALSRHAGHLRVVELRSRRAADRYLRDPD